MKLAIKLKNEKKVKAGDPELILTDKGAEFKDGSEPDIIFTDENIKLKNVSFRVNKGVQRHVTPTGEKKLIVLGKRGESLSLQLYLRDSFDFKGMFGYEKMNEFLKAEKIESILFYPPEVEEDMTIFSAINSFYKKTSGQNLGYRPAGGYITAMYLQPNSISINDVSESNLKILSLGCFIKQVI